MKLYVNSVTELHLTHINVLRCGSGHYTESLYGFLLFVNFLLFLTEHFDLAKAKKIDKNFINNILYLDH